jgi:FixJ family two-component response regulator
VPDAIIYVLDDDADLATSLARLISRGGYPASGFQDPNRVQQACTGQLPDALLTDVMMGAFDGFEVANAVKSAHPTVAVVFMTAWPKSTAAVDAVRAFGGTDYLEKPIDEERLFQAIERAVAWSRTQKLVRDRLAKLTAREMDVFRLLCRGLSNKMVAANLGIHPKTVEDHRASVMRKSQTNSLAQLIELERML